MLSNSSFYLQHGNYTYEDGTTVPAINFSNQSYPAYFANGHSGALVPTDFYANGTQILLANCNLTICNQDEANMTHPPNLAGNAILGIIFAALLLTQIPLGIIYRTWGFTVAVFFGIVLEVGGYIGRVSMHHNLFNQSPFLLYIVCVTVAPAFLSAAIYLCLGRVITVYGQEFARFRPFVYTVIFMVSDFFSLCLQGAGGGIASTANTRSGENLGVNIMIAGLVFQVVSLTIFIGLSADFAFQVRKSDSMAFNPAFAELRPSKRFSNFLIFFSVATVAIFIRSVYRVAELKAGFHSKFANNETLYFIFEAAMVTIACLLMTILHPGLVFRRQWKEANFRMRAKGGLSGKESTSLSSLEQSQEFPAAQQEYKN